MIFHAFSRFKSNLAHLFLNLPEYHCVHLENQIHLSLPNKLVPQHWVHVTMSAVEENRYFCDLWFMTQNFSPKHDKFHLVSANPDFNTPFSLFYIQFLTHTCNALVVKAIPNQFQLFHLADSKTKGKRPQGWTPLDGCPCSQGNICKLQNEKLALWVLFPFKKKCAQRGNCRGKTAVFLFLDRSRMAQLRGLKESERLDGPTINRKKKCQFLCPTTKIHPSFWAPKKRHKKDLKKKIQGDDFFFPSVRWVSRTLQVHLAISPESGQNKSFLATKKKNISFLCQGGWKSDGPTSLNGFLIGWTNPFEKYDIVKMSSSSPMFGVKIKILHLPVNGFWFLRSFFVARIAEGSALKAILDSWLDWFANLAYVTSFVFFCTCFLSVHKAVGAPNAMKNLLQPSLGESLPLPLARNFICIWIYTYVHMYTPGKLNPRFL